MILGLMCVSTTSPMGSTTKVGPTSRRRNLIVEIGTLKRLWCCLCGKFGHCDMHYRCQEHLKHVIEQTETYRNKSLWKTPVTIPRRTGHRGPTPQAAWHEAPTAGPGADPWAEGHRSSGPWSLSPLGPAIDVPELQGQPQQPHCYYMVKMSPQQWQQWQHQQQWALPQQQQPHCYYKVIDKLSPQEWQQWQHQQQQSPEYWEHQWQQMQQDQQRRSRRPQSEICRSQKHSSGRSSGKTSRSSDCSNQ